MILLPWLFLSGTMMALPWRCIDQGSGAVTPDQRGGMAALLPRLWTSAAPLDIVLIHPDVLVPLECLFAIVLVILSQCPCLLPHRPPARLLQFKIPACYWQDDVVDGTTGSPAPPSHQCNNNVLGVQGTIAGQFQWIVVGQS